MAHSLSAKKRVRQNDKQRQRNRVAKSRMRTIVRKFREEVAAGNMEEARAFLPSVYKEIDVISKRGIVHDATASRYKSRLARLLNRETVTS